MGERIEGRLTLGVDVAHILIFHPADLEHASERPLGWYAEPAIYPGESAAGRLVAWSTGDDGVFDVRVTDLELSDRERRYAGPSWAFPYTVRHGRIFVDNTDAVPGTDRFSDPNELEANWIDIPNGDYRVVVTGVDWSIEPGIAEDGSDGLPDFMVQFLPVIEAIEPARRPPSIRPFRNEIADDTVLNED